MVSDLLNRKHEVAAAILGRGERLPPSLFTGKQLECAGLVNRLLVDRDGICTPR